MLLAEKPISVTEPLSDERYRALIDASNQSMLAGRARADQEARTHRNAQAAGSAAFDAAMAAVAETRRIMDEQQHANEMLQEQGRARKLAADNDDATLALILMELD